MNTGSSAFRMVGASDAQRFGTDKVFNRNMNHEYEFYSLTGGCYEKERRGN